MDATLVRPAVTDPEKEAQTASEPDTATAGAPTAPLSTADLLVRAGFSRIDGKTYAALTPHGMNIAEICRISQLERPTTYRAITRLTAAGLITTGIRGKRTVYQSVPARLREILLGAVKENGRMLRAVHPPAATGVHRTADNVVILRGAKAVAKVLTDVADSLGRNDVYYRVSSRSPGTSLEGFIPADYNEKRDAKKLQNFAIVSAGLRAAPFKKRTDGLSRVLPGEEPFDYDIALVIYGDKVATIDYRAAWATIVQNERLAKFHARLFRAVFDQLAA